jgi:hypothetical protein
LENTTKIAGRRDLFEDLTAFILEIDDKGESRDFAKFIYNSSLRKTKIEQIDLITNQKKLLIASDLERISILIKNGNINLAGINIGIKVLKDFALAKNPRKVIEN